MTALRSLWLAVAVVLGLSLAASGGVTVSGGGVSWPILDTVIGLSDSDVGHGITDSFATTTFFNVGPESSTAGGAQISGLSDVAGTSGVVVAGYVNGNPTAAAPAVRIEGWKKSGTARVALATTDGLLSIFNGATQLWTMDATGQLTAVGTAPTTAHILGPAANFEIGSAVGRNLYFSTNGGTDAVIISSGQLFGINTFPTYRLHVSHAMATGLTRGVFFDIASASAQGDYSNAFEVDFTNGGYVGATNTIAILGSNVAAGTSTAFGGGNMGTRGGATATTVGNNMGSFGLATGAVRSFGSWGEAVGNKASSTYIGVAGWGQNDGATSVEIGGYFSLENGTYPTAFVSAALVANNSDRAKDIFIAQDGGPTTPITVFRIADGGGVGIASVATTAAPTAPAAGTIQWGTGGTVATHLLGPSDASYEVSSGAGQSLILSTGAGTDALTVDSTQKVTFNGTSAPTITGPAATFEITSAASQVLTLSSAGGTDALSISTGQAVTIKAGASEGLEAKLGGSLFVGTTTVGNVDTGEDNLSSYAVPSAALNANGDSIRFSAAGSIAGGATTKTLKVKFGGTTILTISQVAGTAGSWTVDGWVIRTGAATQKCYAAFHTSSTGTAVASASYTTAAETLANSITLQFTGESSATTDDVVQEALTVEWVPGNT